jgi:hypothetical protein
MSLPAQELLYGVDGEVGLVVIFVPKGAVVKTAKTTAAETAEASTMEAAEPPVEAAKAAAECHRCVLLISSVALSVLLGLLVGALGTSAKATGLECPEIGHTGVPELTSDSSRAKLLVGGSSADLANENSESIDPGGRSFAAGCC